MRKLPLSAAIAALPLIVHAPASMAEEKMLPELQVHSRAESAASETSVSGDSARLLEWEPGVSSYGAGGVSSLPAIHGLADDRLRIKVDGMDLISACSNHMNPPLSYMDPSQVGSMTAMTGITPVSQGGDSIGGTIIANSAAPRFAKNGGMYKAGNAGAFYRSNGNAMGAHLNAVAATEQLSVSYSGATAESENYKAASAFHRAGPATTGRSFISGDVVGSSAYKSENNRLAFALKSENHLTELTLGMQTIPYQGFPNQRMDMTRNDSRQFNLSDLGQYGWGSMEARVYHERTRHAMNFLNDKQFWYGTAPGMPMDTEGINTGALAKASINLTEGQTLRAGAEYQRYRLNDWWSPSGTGGMAPNTFTNINDGQRDRAALFAELETQWNTQWQSQFGIRTERVAMDTGIVQGYKNTGAVYPAVASAFNALNRKRTDNNLDLAAQARFTPEETRSIEFGYSRKTRSPSLYERYTWSTQSTMVLNMNNWVGDGNGYVGNPNLKPEVAHTLSATSTWNGGKDRWAFKVTPYYTYVQNYIDAVACPSCATRSDGFRNLTLANQSARLYGLDLSGHLPLGSISGWGDFSTKGILSYSRGKNDDTQDNLYNIMPLNARWALDQRKGAWTGTLEVQLVERKSRVSQVRHEMVTGGYSLMNLRGSYQWQQVRLDFGVENLFNKAYALPLGGAYVGQGSTMGTSAPWGTQVPGPARSLYVAGNVSF